MNCTPATPSHDHSASIHFARTGPLTRHDTFSGLLRCGGSCLDAAVLPFIALLSMLRSALDLLPNHEGHVYKGPVSCISRVLATTGSPPHWGQDRPSTNILDYPVRAG